MNKVVLAGCVILKGNSILLLRRIKSDWYELPGGKIDNGETAEQAAIREVKEELLCDVEIVKLLGEKDFEENGYVMGYKWFLAEIKDGQSPKIGEKEKFDHLKYIRIDELKNEKLSNNMKNVVELLFGGF